MYAMVVSDSDDVFFHGRRLLGQLRDPRSDARRLARLVDCLPRLADAVVDRAEVLLCGRGRVSSTASAITLIGFERLERTVREFLRAEHARRRAAEAAAAGEGEAVDLPPPVSLALRYAAM